MIISTHNKKHLPSNLVTTVVISLRFRPNLTLNLPCADLSDFYNCFVNQITLI